MSDPTQEQVDALRKTFAGYTTVPWQMAVFTEHEKKQQARCEEAEKLGHAKGVLENCGATQPIINTLREYSTKLEEYNEHLKVDIEKTKADAFDMLRNVQQKPTLNERKKKLFTRKNGAKYLHVSYRTMCGYVRNKMFPNTIGIGKTLQIPQSDLDAVKPNLRKPRVNKETRWKRVKQDNFR